MATKEFYTNELDAERLKVTKWRMAHDKAVQTNITMKGMLKVAKCPNNCDDGAIPYGDPADPDWYECEWCAMRNILLPPAIEPKKENRDLPF